MKSQWITRGGKKIFIADFSKFRTDVDGLKAEMNAAYDVMGGQAEKSILVMVDLRETFITPEVSNLIKDNIERVNKFIDRGAIIGLSGGRRLIFDVFSRFSGSNAVSFDDVDKAQEWLAKA